MQIFKADRVDGTYTNLLELPDPPNSPYSEGTMQIAPDQSYIIYDSNRPGYGLHDLYVSFKNQDDTWSPSQNFGSPINGSHEEVFPGLSPDDKYMFFVSLKPGDLGYNPYWVSSCVIDPLNPLEVIDDDKDQPSEMMLEQNYPNPFNSVTTIKYSVPVNGNVKLTVYNTLGQQVAELINKELKAGSYDVKFSGKSQSASGGVLASGVYFYQIKIDKFIQTKKMILLK